MLDMNRVRLERPMKCPIGHVTPAVGDIRTRISLPSLTKQGREREMSDRDGTRACPTHIDARMLNADVSYA